MGYPLNTLGETLTTQIREILTGGDGKVPPSKNSFVTFCAPGLPLTAEAFDFAASGLGTGKDAEADKKLLNQAFNWAQLVDFIPDVTAAYQNGHQDGVFRPGDQKRLSSIYGEILRFSKVVHRELTAAERAKIAKFRKLLYTTRTVTDIVTDEVSTVTEDGPILKAYYAKQAAYAAAALQYNAKRVAAMSATGVEGKAAIADWSANAELYRLQVKAAMDAWISGGYRNEVDKINAFINSIGRRDMLLWKQTLIELFDDAIVNGLAPGQRFLFTSLIPGDFARSGGWTRYSLSHSTVDTSSQNSSSSWSAKAGVNFGLFSFGANGGGSSSHASGNTEVSEFKLTMELCPVVVSRPWYYPEFFQNRGWTLNKGEGWLYDEMPSDGARPPKGNFIGYPTMALFARDVKIDSREFASAYSSFQKQIGAGGSVGWGPFTLSGSYSHSSGGSTFQARETAQGLAVDGMQCIAFVNHLIGKAPNPLPELKPADFA
jgi:hypothetical protein